MAERRRFASIELTEPLRPGVVRPTGGDTVLDDDADCLCVLIPMQVV